MLRRIVTRLAKPMVSQVPPVSSFITYIPICETFYHNYWNLLYISPCLVILYLPSTGNFSLTSSIVVHTSILHPLLPPNFLRSSMTMGLNHVSYLTSLHKVNCIENDCNCTVSDYGNNSQTFPTVSPFYFFIHF